MELIVSINYRGFYPVKQKYLRKMVVVLLYTEIIAIRYYNTNTHCDKEGELIPQE